MATRTARKTTEDTRSATEIAASAAAEAGIQPIDLPHTNRSGQADAPRAEKRGVYTRDTNKADRVVIAAGDPIPAGFTLESDAPLSDRAANTRTVHPDVGDDADGTEGNSGEAEATVADGDDADGDGDDEADG
jgi:hypothetical protein